MLSNRFIPTGKNALSSSIRNGVAILIGLFGIVVGTAHGATITYTLTKGPLAEGANAIGWVVDDPRYQKASDLWNALSPALTGIFRWNPTWQKFMGYDPLHPETDFPLVAGEGYVLVVNSDVQLTLNGSEAPFSFTLPHNSSTTSVHLLAIPPSTVRAGVATASQLAAGIPFLDGLSYWDAASQQFVSYVPGVMGSDFSLAATNAYFVSVSRFSQSISNQAQIVYIGSGDSIWLQLPPGAPPLDQIGWYVNGVLGGDAINGTISTAGVYKAPTSATPGTQIRIEARDAQGNVVASYSVVIASVTIRMTPTSILMPPKDSYAFVAQVTAQPDVPELKQVRWLVNNIPGGNSEFGFVDTAGNYTAPTQIPSAMIKVQAQSVLLPQISSYATVTLGGVPGPLTVDINPKPAAVPVGTSVPFTATVKDAKGNIKKSAVRWYVNGVEHGNADAGEITNAGIYKAPLDFYVTAVTVKAVPEIDHSISASTTFNLAKLTVKPDVIDSGTTPAPPGTKFPLTIQSMRSNGTVIDVSKAGTTKLFSPDTSIAYEDPYATQKTVVMGDGAGLAVLQVEDQDPNLSGPAVAKMVVINRPVWTPYAEPAGPLYSVKPGERIAVHIGAKADRGPRKQAFTDSTFDPGLIVQASNALGAVSTDGSVPPNESQLAAWYDQSKGEIVFGQKPGSVTFNFLEPLSGQYVSVVAQLIPLGIMAGRRVDGGVYYQSTPSVVFTPNPDQQPFGRWNNRVLINSWIYDKSGTLAPDQIMALLGGTRIVMEDVYGTGLMLPGPVLYEPGTFNFLAEVPGTDYYSYTANITRMNPTGGMLMAGAYRFVGPQPPSQGASIQLIPQIIPASWFSQAANYPNGLLMASAEFVPGRYGANAVRISLPGTTAAPFEASIQGILPSLKLAEYTYFDTNGTKASGLTRPPGVYGFDVIGPPFNTFLIETAYGFELELHATNGSANARVERFGPPDETSFGPADIHTRFKALLDAPGAWTLRLRARGYAQDLAPAINITVEQENKGLVMTTTGDPIAGPLLQPTNYTLAFYDEYGTPVVRPDPNNNPNNLPTPEVRITSFSQLNGSIVDLYCQGNPKRGHIRLALTSGEPSSQGGWMPPIGNNQLSFSATTMTPLQDGCLMPVSFFYSIPVVGVTSEANGMTFEPIEFDFFPSLAWLPTSAYSSNVQRSFTIVSAKPITAFNNGQALQPSQVRLVTRDAYGNPQPVAWASSTLAAVDVYSTSTNTYATTVQITFDMYGQGFAFGRYEMELGLPKMTKYFPVTVAGLKLSGPVPGSNDALPLLPLNAVWDRAEDQWLWQYRNREMGMTSMEVHMVAGAGAAGGMARLRAGSSRDAGAFHLAGFARSCQDVSPGFQCSVDNEAIVYIPPQEPSRVALVGNLTDIYGTKYPGGEIGDAFPDVVSTAPNDIYFSLLDIRNPSTVLVADVGARTTAFNFIARHKPMNYGDYNPLNYKDYYTAVDWLSSEWGDPYSLASFYNPPPRIWDATPYVDGPRYYGVYDQTYGILDMPWLLMPNNASGAWEYYRVARDRRAYSFAGLGPIGDPYVESSITLPTGWRSFGLTLDGVCYDPGLAGIVGDVPPMSSTLFDLRTHPSLYLRRETGLLRHAGGTSGGLVGPNGGFILASRTPGVDFADVDCGYQVEGVPLSLQYRTIEWVLPGTDTVVPFNTPGAMPRLGEAVYDDIEDVGARGGISGMQLDASANSIGPRYGSLYPHWVAMFATEYESKHQKITTGMKIAGPNTGFEIATDPALADGSPLLVARLNAGMMLFQEPMDAEASARIDSSQANLVRLTARIDPAYHWYKPLSHLLVSGTAALVTGAIGAAFTPGGLAILHAALLSAGVSIVMQGTDDLHVNPVTGALNILFDSGGEKKVSGAIVGSSASTTANKIVSKSIGKGVAKGAVVGSTGGTVQVAQDVTKLEKGASTFTKVVTETGAFTVDVAGGILASVINDYLDARFKQAYVGASMALVQEQMMLSAGTAPRAGADPYACGIGAPAGWLPAALTRDLAKSRTTINVGSAYLTLDGTGAKLLQSSQTNIKSFDKHPALATEGKPYYVMKAPVWRGGIVQLQPGAVRTDYKSGAQFATDDFRLCVGGADATFVPYTHTMVVTTSRSTEEGTASAVVDRSGKHRLLLTDTRIEAAELR